MQSLYLYHGSVTLCVDDEISGVLHPYITSFFLIRDVTLSDNSRILIVKSVVLWLLKRDPFPFFLFMTEEFYARYSYIM